MQPLIPPVDAARRARAAMACAGLDAKDVARATRIGKATLDRITSRTSPQNGTIDRLWTIADACQVPRSFMARRMPLLDRHLEAKLDRLLAELERRR